jgi:CRP-like cAMP-binding protein
LQLHIDTKTCICYNEKAGEESLNPAVPRTPYQQYNMKHERRRSFFCFDTEKNNGWNREGVSAQEALALVALVLKVKLGGMVYASQSELAAAVKCSRPTLSKGLKGLIDRDLVSVVGRAKYQINPQIGTKLA